MNAWNILALVLFALKDCEMFSGAVGVVLLEQEHGFVGVSERLRWTVHQVGGQAWICQVLHNL